MYDKFLCTRNLNFFLAVDVPSSLTFTYQLVGIFIATSGACVGFRSSKPRAGDASIMQCVVWRIGLLVVVLVHVVDIF